MDMEAGFIQLIFLVVFAPECIAKTVMAVHIRLQVKSNKLLMNR